MKHLRMLVFFGLGLLLPLSSVASPDDYFANVPPPGELIQLPTHKLHMVKKGEGGPTIVFESGLDADGHQNWINVHDALAQHTTTVAYDRAGIAWSERGNNPKTIQAMATELHQLLEATEVSKPYILVGQSLAGFILRSFVSQYPDDVAGVVFIDVSHPEQYERFPPEIPELQMPQADEVSLKQLQLGLQHEVLSLPTLFTQAAEITSFGDTPLIVIAANQSLDTLRIPGGDEAIIQQLNDSWLTMQRELLDLSTDSRFVLATESGHYVQFYQPQLVIDAVTDLLARVR